jgi:5'-3' exonuclease
VNCTELNFINNKKEIFYEKYNYIIIDINSLTIVPYINSDKYQSSDRIIITPFVETIKFYIKLKSVLPNTKFIFIFDGGVSSIIKKIYPKYKLNRRNKNTMSILDGNKNNTIDYNTLLISTILGFFNEIVLPSNLIKNETDFIAGYILKSLLAENPELKILLMSHDHDYMQALSSNVHVIYKYTSKTRVTNYFIKNFECITEIIDFPYLKNIEEYVLYKSLTGDTSDNIDKPFGLKSVVPVKNFFTDSYIEGSPVTYESVLAYFKKYFKLDNVFNLFEKDFRRNLFITNIFNDDIISDNDKLTLNNKIDDILYPEVKDVEINSIYELILGHGLYFNEDELDELFKYLKTR